MCALYRDDDIEMGSNAAYGIVGSQYEDTSVPDKPRDVFYESQYEDVSVLR